MKKKYHLIALLLIATSAFVLIFRPLISSPDLSREELARNYFESEDTYIQFIENNVSFDDLNLRVVSVKRGDNFWKLAQKYGVDIDTLIGANPHWNDLIARIDQKIVIPSEKGILHFTYKPGDTEELTEMFDIADDEILVQDLPLLHGITYRFKKEKKPVALFIPGAKPSPDFMQEDLARQFRVREMFRSPLGGRYSSFYGRRTHPIFKNRGFHNGVDIAAPRGTLVGAARGGRVISTGWMGGYGKAVVIRHDNGYKTLYGHLSRILVRQGTRVKSGSLIGRVGSTGFSTGPHLHFTIWHHGRLVNPMNILW